MVSKKTVILYGPTATGKSDVAMKLCQANPKLEIINADSILVFKEFNLGSAKPSLEELNQVRHHLIDIRSPNETYTAGDFKRDVEDALKDIQKREKRALIVGGTGFYLKALIYGLWGDQDPKVRTHPEIREKLEKFTNEELHKKIKKIDPPTAIRVPPSDRYRMIRSLELYETTGRTPTQWERDHPHQPDSRFELIYIDRETKELEDRIDKRTHKMIEAGWIEETRELLSKYPQSRTLGAVGYSQVVDYLKGVSPKGRKIKPGQEGLIDEVCLATRQLVKRQRTWFKGQFQSPSFLLDRDYPLLKEKLEKIYG